MHITDGQGPSNQAACTQPAQERLLGHLCWVIPREALCLPAGLQLCVSADAVCCPNRPPRGRLSWCSRTADHRTCSVFCWRLLSPGGPLPASCACHEPPRRGLPSCKAPGMANLPARGSESRCRRQGVGWTPAAAQPCTVQEQHNGPMLREQPKFWNEAQTKYIVNNVAILFTLQAIAHLCFRCEPYETCEAP